MKGSIIFEREAIIYFAVFRSCFAEPKEAKNFCNQIRELDLQNRSFARRSIFLPFHVHRSASLCMYNKASVIKSYYFQNCNFQFQINFFCVYVPENIQYN